MCLGHVQKLKKKDVGALPGKKAKHGGAPLLGKKAGMVHSRRRDKAWWREEARCGGALPRGETKRDGTPPGGEAPPPGKKLSMLEPKKLSILEP